MNEFDKLHQHIKECVDSNNELFFVKTDDGLELNIFDLAFGLSCSAKKEVNALATDRQNAISLMSKSWQHDREKQDDLITRYVTMAENQFKKKDEEIDRLTDMATKHAAVNDERYELLEKQKSDIEKMLDQLFHHENIDAWLVCKMNDMLDDVNHQLDKARTEADK